MNIVHTLEGGNSRSTLCQFIRPLSQTPLKSGLREYYDTWSMVPLIQAELGQEIWTAVSPTELTAAPCHPPAKDRNRTQTSASLPGGPGP